MYRFLIGLIGTIFLVGFCSSFVMAETKTEAKTEAKSGKMDIDFFGQIQTQLEYGSGTDVDPEVTSEKTKFGVKGNQRLWGDIYTFGRFSIDADVLGDGADDLRTRFAFIGLGHDLLGELSVGKTESITDVFVNKTMKVFTLRGNNGIQKPTRKQKSSLLYTNSFKDIKLGVQVQMTDDDAQNDTFDTWQIGGEFKNVGLSYGKDNVTSTVYYGVGAKHNLGSLFGAANFTVKDDDTDANDRVGYELAVGYDVTQKLTLVAGWQDTDFETDKGSISTEARYKFAKNITAFVDYENDRTTEEWVSAAGVRIKF